MLRSILSICFRLAGFIIYNSEMKLAELAKIVGAEVAQSDGDIEITGAAGLDEAEPGHITFLSNPRYTPRVKGTRASAIFVAAATSSEGEIATVQAQDPYLAYTRALRVFHPETQAEP